MTPPGLDDRSRDVLKSLIQLHIATGQPVGSETLARMFQRSVSSATLRNIMADLERMGYLTHPHTSAGRMPTDEGYRVYVDTLMRHEPLPARDAAAISSEMRDLDASPNQVMEHASHVLSKHSGNVGFVLVPDMAGTSFRHIDLVRLPHPRILVVMVARTGLVTNKVIEVEDQLSQGDLQACANYLNAHFAGLDLAAIRGRLLELVSQEKALYDSLLKSVVSVGGRAFAGQGEPDLFLDGTSNMLDQGEFEDADRMRSVFKAFEEKTRLVKILNACLSERGVRIVIGQENPDPALRATAMVVASCPVDGETGWGLGVVGSTRMEYARMIALVEHVAAALDQTLKDLRP
jgi:heat-inducible transcriptional repressor